MRVAVAGTFGPIHDGHRALFETALERGTEGIVVAITSDDLAEETRKKPRPMPSFPDRRAAVEAAIESLDRWNRDVRYERLDGRYEIASTDPTIDALVTSPETCGEIAEINRLRAREDLEPIEGIVVPYVRAGDGRRISSTRLVAGEIDEHGDLRE